MHARIVALLTLLAPLSLPAAQSPTELSQRASAGSAASVRAAIDKYCVRCHSERMKSGGLALEGLNLDRVSDHAAVFEKVIRKLRAGVMPPPGMPRPDPSGYRELIAFLEKEIDTEADMRPNAGRTDTAHRLNRVEYQNAIRDLLALEINAAEYLPSDDATGGFDNVASALKMSPTLMERYLSAAEKISRLAVGRPALPSDVVFQFRAQLQQNRQEEGAPFGTRGGGTFDYVFPANGEYVLSIKLDGRSPDPQQLEIAIDGKVVKTFADVRGANSEEAVTKGVSAPKSEVRALVTAGAHKISTWFVMTPSVLQYAATQRKEYTRGIAGNSGGMSPALVQIRSLTVAGPFAAVGPGDTRSRRRIFVCRPLRPAQEPPCAKRIVSELATRAYRRPATDADVAALVKAYEDEYPNGGFEQGIQAAIWQLLVSPNFLFRIEADPTPETPRATAASTPNTQQNYRIGNFELASRLSFFLWSSVPDEPLLSVARRGKLQDAAVLEQQVRRMLADPRSKALMDNFVGQWLYLRNVTDMGRPVALFPNFDETLKDSFVTETSLFFDNLMREDRSILDVLRADYTFVNERLARHYGIPNVQGNFFRRVTFTDDKRLGILGHGSLLAVTSQPNRTSPVNRGKWILENVLGSAPPPPPPNVPKLEEQEGGAGTEVLSMRERMAQHRKNPTCASCHSTLDPLGFALENFDAVGRWRDVDEAFGGIDASGTLPSGEKFANLAEFRKKLLRDPETFVIAFTEKLLTYALGRVVFYYDMPAVRKIVHESARSDYRFSSLVLGIVKSTPFQMRRRES